MEPLKQISVKIDPITLGKMDKMANSWPYHKRNAIINGILNVVFDALTPLEINRMLRYSRYYYDKPTVTFTLPEPHKYKPIEDGN